MKIETGSEIEVQDTLAGERIDLKLADEALDHIMEMLTNLYSDPQTAIIREYATNARDAHIEAGIDRPIEVITPTRLSSGLLRIKDHGVGLSVADLHNIYSQYGASTKRDSNAQTGALGFGCKSALAYADQFTVTSTKDGTRIQAAVARDENGKAAMTVVDTCATDDPNGTEVIIPTNSSNDLETKARALFAYWPKGSVLLNGAEPEKHADAEIVRLSPAMYLKRGGPDVIVMGGVPYPTTALKETCKRHYSWSLVVEVPIGSVMFAPSREALRDTKTTRDTIAAIIETYKREVTAACQREVDKAKTAPEAIRAAVRFKQAVTTSLIDVRWRGHRLPLTLQSQRRDFMLTANESYALGKASEYPALSIEVLADCVWVTDYEPRTFSANQKKKLQIWAGQNGLADVRSFVLTTDPAPKRWIDPKRVVSYEDTIKPIKLPSTSNGIGSSYLSGRLTGSYDCWVNGARSLETPASDIDTKKPLYYMHGNIHEGGGYYNVLSTVIGQYTLVCLPGNRLGKFQRDFPQAVEVRDGLVAAAKAFMAKLTDEQTTALAMSDSGMLSSYAQLSKLGKLNDPRLRKLAKAATMAGLDLLAEQRTILRRSVGIALIPQRIEYDDVLGEDYPLYDLSTAINRPKHVQQYLNAAYAASRKETK